MALFGLFVKILVSLALWPLAFCMGYALLETAWALPIREPRLLAFYGGAAAYAVIQALFWRPLFMYVMGHELTHALASVLQGGKADDLHVSTKGGQVKVNVSNFLVNLAPYFFPIYTALLMAVFWVADDRFRIYIVFLLGVSLAFHLALTAYSLRQHQSDIHEVGWLFAIPFILALNVAIVAFVLSQAVPQFSLRGWAGLSLQDGKLFALWIRSLF